MHTQQALISTNLEQISRVCFKNLSSLWELLKLHVEDYYYIKLK